MATQSKTKSQARRREDRRRLREAVDRILDGPDDSDVDRWVVQVLVDLGSFVRAAAPALDYEVGRVISGVDRPLGDFGNVSPSNLSWQGAGIAADPQQAKDWIAAGRKARSERPPPATQQRAFASLLRPIASISCYSWLHDLSDALDALSFGEVLPTLTPSARGLAGIGMGRMACWLRLRALAWVEFQVAAGKIRTKEQARERVAEKFGRDVDTILYWRRSTIKELGKAVVHERLEFCRRTGKLWRAINERLANDRLDERDQRFLKLFENAYSDEKLERMAKSLRTFPVRAEPRRTRSALALSLIAAPRGRPLMIPGNAWAALVNGSHVALIRHGNAPPGYGDPPGFKIDDCATQRNMDERDGRKPGRSARPSASTACPWTRSSPRPGAAAWRGRLMALGPSTCMAVAASERSPERLVAMKEMLAAWRGPGTLVLVTHALTVHALVGIMPGQAETVVVRPELGNEPGSTSWAGSLRRGDFLRLRSTPMECNFTSAPEQ